MQSIRLFSLPDSDIVFFCYKNCLYINEYYLREALAQLEKDGLSVPHPAAKLSAAD